MVFRLKRWLGWQELAGMGAEMPDEIALDLERLGAVCTSIRGFAGVDATDVLLQGAFLFRSMIAQLTFEGLLEEVLKIFWLEEWTFLISRGNDNVELRLSA